MPSTSTKTLWILGAGFSRALGGPLIEDLLITRGKDYLKQVGQYFDPTGGMNLQTKIWRAQRFFEYGKKLRLWEHAEQFLDVVETAQASGKPSISRASGSLAGLLGRNIDDDRGESVPILIADVVKLQEYSRLALAADCCLFLRGADHRTERWHPYVQWARKLDESHTIVTFNYDRVPDLLEEAGGRLKVILPEMDWRIQIEVARENGDAPVLKVHGSVDWLWNGEKLSRGTPEAALSDPLGVLIGVPGPAKRDLVKQSGSAAKEAPLQELWTQMRREIQEADRIFFVGYRFPPTDSDARNDCLGAIRENAAGGIFRILTVLGPDTGHRDTARLLALLRAVAPQNRDVRTTVQALPFFAEDFLSLFGAGVDVTGLKG